MSLLPFGYWWALRQLNKRRREKVALFAKVTHQARESKADRNELESLHYERHVELTIIDDEIEEMITRRLTAQAHRLVVPVPAVTEDEGLWEKSSITGTWYLTREGIKAVRAEIRAEQDARLRGWTTWGSVLIGLLGSLTGLVSVWKQ